MISEMSQKISEWNAQFDQQSAHISELEKSIATLQAENTSLHAQLDRDHHVHEEEKQALVGRVVDGQRGVEALGRDMALRDATITRLKADLHTMATARMDREKEVQLLQAQLEHRRSEVATLTTNHESDKAEALRLQNRLQVCIACGAVCIAR